jgi:putative endonuclease
MSKDKKSEGLEAPHVLGQQAEHAAVRLLRSKGYKIIATNFHCQIGEIDAIARDKGELVFVEVRSRSKSQWGDALDAVTKNKQRQVARVAQVYISQKPTSSTIRFDVIAQTGDELLHIIDAFRA